MTGAACRAGNAYPPGAPDFTSGFHRVSCCPVICVSLFHVIVLSFVFWVLIVPFVWLLVSIYFLLTVTDSQSPDFVAPANPCRDTVDYLCSIHCKIMTVTVKDNGILKPCDFCYCENPVNSSKLSIFRAQNTLITEKLHDSFLGILYRNINAKLIM